MTKASSFATKIVRPYVATEIMCRDRAWGSARLGSRQGSTCVAIDFYQERAIPIATEDLMSRQSLQGWCYDRVFFCRNP